jgi:hypothetical protein
MACRGPGATRRAVRRELDATSGERSGGDGTLADRRSGERVAAGLGEELKANREIWRWIAAGALALLLIEWALYRRPRVG